ncbi:MAG: hypothetical protein ACP5PS_01180 [Bacteroidales bacterium]
MTPAKILLFGEYTVLVGSQALAIPFTDFSCQLMQQPTGYVANNGLAPFITYLLSQSYDFIDLERLSSDWQKGLYLKSNIPVQYGVGSSGAVTAEIYRHYAWTVQKDLTQAKTELSTMEKFMHGNSSGIDPLVCLCQKPLLFSHEGTVQLINRPFSTRIDVFLIDSQVKAPTRDYVLRFLTNFKHDSHFNLQIQQLTERVNSCITTFLNVDPQFIEQVKELSQLQLQLFPFLFPESIVTHLTWGLKHDLFYAKLCGSGGGGFFLGFTLNKHAVQQYFNVHQIPIRWVSLSIP